MKNAKKNGGKFRLAAFALWLVSWLFIIVAPLVAFSMATVAIGLMWWGGRRDN